MKYERRCERFKSDRKLLNLHFGEHPFKLLNKCYYFLFTLAGQFYLFAEHVDSVDCCPFTWSQDSWTTWLRVLGNMHPVLRSANFCWLNTIVKNRRLFQAIHGGSLYEKGQIKGVLTLFWWHVHQWGEHIEFKTEMRERRRKRSIDGWMNGWSESVYSYSLSLCPFCPFCAIWLKSLLSLLVPASDA